MVWAANYHRRRNGGGGGGAPGACALPKFHELLHKLLTTLYVVSDCAPPNQKVFPTPLIIALVQSIPRTLAPGFESQWQPACVLNKSLHGSSFLTSNRGLTHAQGWVPRLVCTWCLSWVGRPLACGCTPFQSAPWTGSSLKRGEIYHTSLSFSNRGKVSSTCTLRDVNGVSIHGGSRALLGGKQLIKIKVVHHTDYGLKCRDQWRWESVR